MKKDIQLQLFDHLKQDGYIMWLKLPSYHVPWMVSRYRFPCVIPSYTEMACIIRRGLVNNSKRSVLTRCCLTNEMWKDGTVELSEDERISYVPVDLPDRLMRNGTMLRTSDRWQLTNKSTIELREHIRNLFWSDLASYINDSTYHAVCQGRHISLDAQICDWMDLHNIDLSFIDTIVRQYHRDMQNGQEEIRERLDKYQYDLRTNWTAVMNALNNHQRSGRGQYTDLRRRMAERQQRKNAVAST